MNTNFVFSIFCQLTKWYCLIAIAAEGHAVWQLTAAAVDRYHLHIGFKAANPPQRVRQPNDWWHGRYYQSTGRPTANLLHAADRWDRQTHILPLHRPCHTLCKQCQQKHRLTVVFKWKRQLLIYTAQSSHSFGAENCCKAKTGSLVHHAKISTCKIVQFWYNHTQAKQLLSIITNITRYHGIICDAKNKSQFQQYSLYINKWTLWSARNWLQKWRKK